MIPTYIPKVPISDLVRNTDYPEWDFCGVISNLQANAGIVTQIRPRSVPSQVIFKSFFTNTLKFDAI
jgi:hypothetical protein